MIRTNVLTLTVVVSLLFIAINSDAKTQKVRQVQEVNFSEMNLKGTIRNPDGAYLVQKKGLKFMPLHDVQKDMDQKIRDTSLYID
ncbi:MAG: hypothetical protein H7061_11635 [Bdellovibrionaceae bacterium]|nr:hypothetical protein [Bdellovibrio sp.]